MGANLRLGGHAGLIIVAQLLAACGAGRTPLVLGARGAGGTTSSVASGGQGNGGHGSGGKASGGVGGGGGGRVGGAGGATFATTDAAVDALSLNSHGDCVLSSVSPDGTSITPCSLRYDDETVSPCRWHRWMRGGACGGYLVLAGSEDESMFDCYYEASSGRLVAARDCSDVDQYCDSRAWCAWTGPDLGSCYLDNPIDLASQICPPPDAGKD